MTEAKSGEKPPALLSKWVAGVSATSSAGAVVYGLYTDKKIAILAFIGMVFAMVLLFVVARAAKEVAHQGSTFYERLARFLVVFVLLYFIATASALFLPLIDLFRGSADKKTVAESNLETIADQIFGLKTKAEMAASGESLAESILKIDDHKLNYCEKVEQCECAALGFCLAAQTAQTKDGRDQLSQKALEAANKARKVIAEIDAYLRAGENKYFMECAEFIRDNQIGARVQYIMARATAMQANNADSGKKQEALKLYENLTENFKQTIKNQAMRDEWLGPILSANETPNK